MLTLALNAGSSSLKFALYSSGGASSVVSRDHEIVLLAKGSSKDIASVPRPTFVIQWMGKDRVDGRVPEHDENSNSKDIYLLTLSSILDALEKTIETRALGPLHVVAHRIVHGGNARAPVVIKHGEAGEREALEKIGAVEGFAPLHNHHAVLCVRHCLSTLHPKSTSVLVFDTLFHLSLPAVRTAYPLPSLSSIATSLHLTLLPGDPPSAKPQLVEGVELRKYGFHGISYTSILAQMASHLARPVSSLNLIVLHLGSGSSACLILRGRSANTTMGVTPLDGLPGGTRSGAVDPALVFHLFEQLGRGAEVGRRVDPGTGEAVEGEGGVAAGEYMLNRLSGLKALSGTADFAQIVDRLGDGGEAEEKSKAELAYGVFLDRVKATVFQYVGQLLEALRSDAPGEEAAHFDGLVFSGGIGENAPRLRADVLESLGWLEQLLTPHPHPQTESHDRPEAEDVRRISKDGARVRAYVVKTDEERVLAETAQELLGQD